MAVSTPDATIVCPHAGAIGLSAIMRAVPIQPVVMRRTGVTDRNPNCNRARTPCTARIFTVYAVRNPLGTVVPETLLGRFFIPSDCSKTVVRDCAAGGPTSRSGVTMVPRYGAHLHQP